MSNPTQLPQSDDIEKDIDMLNKTYQKLVQAVETHLNLQEPYHTSEELETVCNMILNRLEEKFDRAIRELARLEGTEFVVDDEEADQSDYENPEEEEEAEFSDSTSEERSEILSSTTEYEDEIVSEEDE